MHPLAEIIARALLANRRARFEATTPKTLDRSIIRRKINKEQECLRRQTQIIQMKQKGKKWWGPPEWKGSYEETFRRFKNE
jgi:hypothetical protein